jgi:hypothetical protein
MAEHSQAAAWPKPTGNPSHPLPTTTSSEPRQNTVGIAKRPLFPLGHVCATPAAMDLMEQLSLSPLEFIVRHVFGDWGQVCQDDREANQAALQNGTRLLSAYELPGGQRLWVLTEADRSLTTLLLPSDY